MQKDLNIKLIQTSTQKNGSSPKTQRFSESDDTIDQEWEHVSNPTQDDINVQSNVDSTDGHDVRSGDIIANSNDSRVGLKAQRDEMADIKEMLYKTRRINQIHSWKVANQGLTEIPFLNILVLVIGSVGDILPFVGLALEMKKYGHRVRFATHRCFEDTIRNTYQLDFFPLGGNPHWMMDFMVRSEGKFFSFSYQSIFKDLPASRQEVRDVLQSTWEASKTTSLWQTDAIVANPPAFGVHVAEKLGVPLHIFFTFPWTPTRMFPHPLVTTQKESISAPLSKPSTLDSLLNWVSSWTLSSDPTHTQSSSLKREQKKDVSSGKTSTTLSRSASFASTAPASSSSSVVKQDKDGRLYATRAAPAPPQQNKRATPFTEKELVEQFVNFQYPKSTVSESKAVSKEFEKNSLSTVFHPPFKESSLASSTTSTTNTLTTTKTEDKPKPSPNAFRDAVNFYSYLFVDQVTFTGLKDIINDFRVCTLEIPALGIKDAQTISKRRIPVSYMWSPSMFVKPPEWGPHVHITGYCTSPLSKEEQEWKLPMNWKLFIDDCRLSKAFLLFVGFGSCVIRNVDKLLEILVQAADQTNCRLILQSNWSSFSKQTEHVVQNQTCSKTKACIPKHLFIKTAPHRLLFPWCDAVCHHGGAGTSYAGLSNGKPTIVVPFFGDQFFWGNWIAKHGFGPEPMPFRTITLAKMKEAFCYVQNPIVQQRTQILANVFQEENGNLQALQSFHEELVNGGISCELDCRQVARVYCMDCKLHLGLVSDSLAHGQGNNQDEYKSHRRSRLLSFPSSHGRMRKTPDETMTDYTLFESYQIL